MEQRNTVTMDKEGIYIYQCDSHIGNPVKLFAAKQEAEKMSKNFAMN